MNSCIISILEYFRFPACHFSYEYLYVCGSSTKRTTCTIAAVVGVCFSRSSVGTIGQRARLPIAPTAALSVCLAPVHASESFSRYNLSPPTTSSTDLSYHTSVLLNYSTTPMQYNINVRAALSTPLYPYLLLWVLNSCADTVSIPCLLQVLRTKAVGVLTGSEFGCVLSFIFPARLTPSRVGNPTGLTHSPLSVTSNRNSKAAMYRS